MASFAHSQLALSKVLLVPAGSPWQRQPRAAAKDRLQMTRLAAMGHPFIEVDTREIERLTPTYTIDTLEELRQQYASDQRFCLILGTDAFLNLPTWKEWTRILELTHIAVLCRPGFDFVENQLPIPLRPVWSERHCTPEHLTGREGQIVRLDMPPVPVSSTQIRHALAHSLPCPEGLLPSSVWNYIDSHHLYRSA
jgi:nicotinate-nucleotide adenylyltransferase